MYPIGRNKTVFTTEIFDEAYKILWGDPYRKATRKYIIIFAAILVAGFALLGAVHLPVYYLIPGLAFYVAVLYYILVQIPRANKKKLYKRMAMGANGEPWRSYVFYQDHVTVTFPNETTEDVSYDDFTDISHGDKIILIHTTGKRNILLDKNGFIGEVPELLQQK